MSAKEIPLKSDFWERARVNDIPVARLIGFEAKEIADGRATVVLAAGPQHANPMGTLHGGILCDIADAAMGIAFASTLAPGESFTTVELKINFFRPVWQAQLKAEGTVVRRGHTIGGATLPFAPQGISIAGLGRADHERSSADSWCARRDSKGSSGTSTGE